MRGDYNRGPTGSQAYSPGQVESVLREIGVDVAAETTNDFLCFCPYHGNRHTPSFSVGRTGGAYICFNHSCGATGTLVDLVKNLTKKDDFAARRVILLAADGKRMDAVEEIQKALATAPEFTEFSSEVMTKMQESLWTSESAVEYMKGRGFSEETLREFGIGYSEKKNLISVPMHDPKGMLVGVIGRKPDDKDKVFKNSVGLPTSKTLWNFHRVKKLGDTVIVTEASFDAMRVSQAGYPNVVACLGGHFSPYHTELLSRTFSTIIVMTDFDKKEKHMYKDCRKCHRVGYRLCIGHNPGRDLGATIAQNLSSKRVLWAAYERGVVYPHDAKDAGDMTDEEIRTCLRNAVSNFEYQTWDIY